MDVGITHFLTFFKEDEDWLKKMGIAGLVYLIPLIGPLAFMGWALKITEDTIRGKKTLPGWDDWGDFLTNGLKFLAVVVVWIIPLIILQTIQTILLNIHSDLVILKLMFAFVNLLGMLYDILMLTLTPAYMAVFVRDNYNIGSAINPTKVIQFYKAVPKDVFIPGMLAAIVASALVPVGLLLCVIGVAFTAAYAYTVVAYVSGMMVVSVEQKQGVRVSVTEQAKEASQAVAHDTGYDVQPQEPPTTADWEG